MRGVGLLSLVLALGSAGCASENVDVDAEQRGLLEADRAAYRGFSDSGFSVDALLSGFADDVVFLPPEAPMVEGREAVRAFVSQYTKAPGFAIEWRPTKVEVSRSGDIGYTIGTEEITVNDVDGKPVTTQGKYVTIWKKDEAGKWMVIADMFSTDSPARHIEE